MQNDRFSTFPSNRTEALALLYLQSQDLSGKTPEEIQTMYFEAYYKLRADYQVKRKSSWIKGLKEPE